MKERIYMASPTMHGEEQKFVQEAFDTNWIAPLGPNVNGFEREMEAYTGIAHCSALSAGTAALHLAVKLLEVGEGDTVICPSLTFAATANPVAYEKGKIVFVDSEPETWNMSPQALKRALEEHKEAKAVIVAHLYGTPAKVDEIKAICEEYKVPLIEDAAESLGATYKGVQTGRFGVMAGFSFNGNKIITTSGGGMIASENEEYIKHATFLATQAKNRSDIMNTRRSDITTECLISQRELEEVSFCIWMNTLRRKKTIYETYKDAFKDYKQVHMNPYETCSEPNFWLSCMTINEDSKTKPLDIIEALEQENIESRPIWKPLHQQPVFKGCEFYSHYEDDKKPVSEDIFDRGLCLPSDIKNTKEDMDRIIGIIRSVLDR